MKEKVFNFVKKPIVLVFLIPLVLWATGSLAKYVIEEFHGYYTNSEHFYFSSNLLTQNNELYVVNNWMGVGQFDIDFDLLSSVNDYVFADYDIPYTVTVTCPPADATCVADKPTGTIYKASHQDTITVTVNPLRQFTENQLLEIHIEAESVRPYVQKLEATFRYVVGKQGATYEIEDETRRAYMLLKVTNAMNYCTVIDSFGGYNPGKTLEASEYITLSHANKQKCVGQNVSLDFNPNIILLDTTSDLLNDATYTTTLINGVNYINHLEFPVGPLSTVSVKYYKQDTSYNYKYPDGNNQSIVTVSITDPVVPGS